MNEVRLIDANALKTTINNKYLPVVAEELNRVIDNAPTVEPPLKPICEIKFDKEQLHEIVQKKVIDKIKSGELVIQEERPKGEWITTRTMIHDGNPYCSNCDEETIIRFKFCPNCGAEMGGRS